MFNQLCPVKEHNSTHGKQKCMLQNWGCAASACICTEPQGSEGKSQSRTTVQPTAALKWTNEMCIYHGDGVVDPNTIGQASRSGLSHELAEMDSLPAQSVRPRLKRSPRRPATPQPFIWIVCAIWIVKRPADRLMHNSKEQAEWAADSGVNSFYFPRNGAHPPVHSAAMLQEWYGTSRPRKRPWSTLHPAVLNTHDWRHFAPQQSDFPAGSPPSVGLNIFMIEFLQTKCLNTTLHSLLCCCSTSCE